MAEATTIIRPTRVVKTTEVSHDTTQRHQKVFAQKKTIFRFYQVIWYILSVIEVLFAFRFLFKALGANPFNGFTSFVYTLTDPLVLPFQGIVKTIGSGVNVIEWATLIAAGVYLIIAYGLVTFLQFVKPVSQEEVEETVDEV